MDKEKIKEAVKVYLQEENSDYAIMLNGKWGSGKTYFVKNELIDHIQEQDNRNVIYISLFGITTIDELYNNISLHLVNIKANEYAQNKRKLYDPRAEKKKINTSDAGNVSFLSTVISKSLNLLPEAGVIKSLTADINNKIIKFDRYVFIFDDLERSSLGYDTLLGFFDKIADQNKLKAILVCNEDKINEKDKDEFYKTFKEKVVGLTIEYNSNMASEFDNIVECYVKDQQCKKCLYEYKYHLLGIFKNANSCNLRTLIFICKRFVEMYVYTIKIYDKYDTDANNKANFLYEFISAITGSSILIKEQNKKNEFKDNYNVLSFVNENQSTSSAYMAYKFIDDYLAYYYYDETIISKVIKEFTGKAELERAGIVGLINSIYNIDDDVVAVKELNKVLEEVEENKFNINIYPKILDNIFILTKTLMNDDKIRELKETIKSNTLERIAEFSSFSWTTFEYHDSEAKEFKNELYKYLKEEKIKFDSSEWLSIFENDSYFVEKFGTYMQKNEGNFGFEGRNMTLIGAEKVFERVKVLNIQQLKVFWHYLEMVFARNVSNLRDFHADDKEFFRELKEKIESELLTEKSSKSKMQKLILKGFCNYLDAIYNKL